MTLLRLAIPLIYTAFLVFSIVDLVTIDPSRVRYLPKFTWIILVILLPLIGGLTWFLAGRERLEPREHGRYGPPPAVRRGPSAPDDDPAFLRSLSREQEQEQRIRQLEERLREIDGDPTAADDKPKQ
jgi:hypothetical protein